MNRISIALSVILSFLGWEFFGLASGGMVSAGYLALFISSPFRILVSVLISAFVYLVMLVLDKFIIIYGKRRFMMCVVLGFVFTWLWSLAVPVIYMPFDVRSIGYIVPGLIANDMLKQGFIKTLLMLIISTVLIALLLMLIVGLGL